MHPTRSTIPKIIAAKAINNHTLIIQFSNHEIKQYDITPLLAKTPFQLLKNLAFFKSFHIEIGGHALVWNEDTAFTSNDWYVRSQMITKLLVGGHCSPYSPLYLLSEVRAVST